MADYQFRPSLFQKPVRYHLNGHALVSSRGREVPFADIRSVRIYRVRSDVQGSSIPGGAQRCVIATRHGRRIGLSSFSFVGIGNFADQSETFTPFVHALVRDVAAANPKAAFIVGMPLALWFVWLAVLFAAAILIPLALGLFLLDLLGGGAIAAVVAGLATLGGIGFSLFYYLPSLGPDWPRRFDPR